MINKMKFMTENDAYVKENYKNATIEELSITLGRSEKSIKSRIQRIKKSSEN